MRIQTCLAGALLGMTLAAPARAQRVFIPLGFSSSAQNVQNVVIDTSNPAAPVSSPTTASYSTGFSLRNLLPRLTPMNNRSVIGQSTFPAYKDLPGPSYLDAFKFGHGIRQFP
jgi:hypothetical protein